MEVKGKKTISLVGSPGKIGSKPGSKPLHEKVIHSPKLKLQKPKELQPKESDGRMVGSPSSPKPMNVIKPSPKVNSATLVSASENRKNNMLSMKKSRLKGKGFNGKKEVVMGELDSKGFSATMENCELLAKATMYAEKEN